MTQKPLTNVQSHTTFVAKENGENTISQEICTSVLIHLQNSECEVRQILSNPTLYDHQIAVLAAATYGTKVPPKQAARMGFKRVDPQTPNKFK